MAITQYSRMQQLRGNYANLDKTKMLVGEIAVSTDHAPIVKADTNKYYELLTAEDAEYLQNITDETQKTLNDINQLAIDKVGINNSVESDLQTYSSRKIQSMHDEQAESITNQINNQFKVLSGTEIVTTDSSSGYATDFKSVGKTEQKQYSGKNLLNNTATTQTIGGITFTVNADGSITANGTNTGNVELYLIPTSNEEVLPAGDYILSGCPSGGSASTYVLDGRITNYYADTGSGKSFTLTEETAIGYIRILIYANANPKNLTFYPMIRKSTTDATYEPYTGGTASPNPDYPQAIFNSGDCVELMQGYYAVNSGAYATSNAYVCNSNQIPCKSGDVLAINVDGNIVNVHFLWYGESGYISYKTATVTDSIATVTVPSGVEYFNFDLVGASGSSGTLLLADVGKVELTINDKYVLQIKSCNKNLYPLENEPFTLVKSTARIKTLGFTPLGSGTYTISFKVSNASLSGSTAGLNVINKAGGYKTIATIGGNGVVSGTINDYDISQLYFFIASSESDTATITISDIQIEYGDTVTEYVPHAENTATILLDEPLRANDKIVCIDGVYGVYRYSDEYTFDGTQAFAKNDAISNNDNYLYYNNNLLKGKAISSANTYCDKLLYKSLSFLNGGNLADNMGIYINETGVVYLNIGCLLEQLGYENNINGVKSALTDYPVTLQYKLAIPTFEPFADQTPFYQIQTFDGGTTVSTTDRLQPQFEVEYPTNRVSGVASEANSKASVLTDKILTYQFRNIEGTVGGAVFSIDLPKGVDGRNCTIIASAGVTTQRFEDMDISSIGTLWNYNVEMYGYVGAIDGSMPNISGTISEATEGSYAHVNVTVIRNDI